MREGDVIADKYRVERVLGVGGMGVVVAAMHVELDERVALKFLLPEGVANPQVAGRFAQEARAAAKIKSEHVARVIDVGRLSDGAPFMVMEYLDGEDLDQVLQRGPVPFADAVGYVLQAGEAIAEAHALGIVHRDLKPANLFLARRPNGPPIIKVLDFGISKSVAAPTSMTKTSAILGSPFYMSPEQMRSSKGVDARTDVWALGVVMYQLISGETPFNGESMTELVTSILTDAPPPLRSPLGALPDGLVEAVARCLEKNPDQRFSNLHELALGLAPFAPTASAISVPRIAHVLSAADAGRTTGSGTRHGAPVAHATARGATGESVSIDARREGATPRRTAAIAVGALFLVAGGIAVAGYMRASSDIRRSAGLASPALSSSTTPSPRSDSLPARPTSSDVADSLPSPVVPTTGSAADPAVPPSAPAAPVITQNKGRAAASPVPTPRRPPAVAPAAPAPSKPDCDPPYVIDPTNGHRNYKPECVQ